MDNDNLTTFGSEIVRENTSESFQEFWAHLSGEWQFLCTVDKAKHHGVFSNKSLMQLKTFCEGDIATIHATNKSNFQKEEVREVRWCIDNA